MISAHHPDNPSTKHPFPLPWQLGHQDSRHVTSALIAALFFPSHGQQPDMCRQPTASAVETVLLPFLPDRGGGSPTVTAVRGSPSLRLPRTYAVELSSGQALQLILPPPSILRLLRFERSLVESEAITIRWIQSQPVPAPLPLPSLIHASHDLPNGLDSPFAFFQPCRGTPLALLAPPITPTARRSVDKHVGSLLRRLATLHSPTGGFGPAAAVIPVEESHRRIQPLGIGGPIGNGGAKTWSLAFQAMLEGILRDSEDMAIGIPYVAARKQFARLGHVLDGVTTPRLVVIDGGEEANILVEDGVVTGLHDWSTCLFGDPLFARVFSEGDGPSEGFMEGFNDSNITSTTTDAGGFTLSTPSPAVDDAENARVRVLLYGMYHALVMVVREFYRPRVDSSRREMEGRKRLNEVLGRLAKVEVGEGKAEEEVEGEVKRVHKRGSGEMSPAKRLKDEER
ncbi:hypothetical protein B0T16DRAFT_388951 [Cercophora newfieldiana]|uniref:Aminoglycoside phosphotransferase domain-containing protein n=1 Tax=Cercophora newfieldiana TaxID=92897 RepID=A0AA39YC59_9PEZI|nr:hypothetical protein B0T16DRAFT_388951 [Cercophora newfieldiana]